MKPLRIGTMSIERIVEFEPFPFDLRWLYPRATGEQLERNLDWLDPRTVDRATQTLILSMHSYLVRTRSSTILIDTCIGAHKQRPSLAVFHDLESPLLDNLADGGIAPEQIDLVLCTHLHADHVGWNTRSVNGQWVPTFPNATYLIARKEYEYFNKLYESNPAQPVVRGAFEDSVLPVVSAGQAKFVESDHVVQEDADERIWLEDASGHTPGQIAVHARGGGSDVVFIGDAIHHPLGVAEPELVMSGDVDPNGAVATRRRLIETYADTNTIVLAAHFPTPTAARFVSAGSGFRIAWA
jgi:glyoxylase-like metal-dependent hydrolase (beta-lactamase superfamily II)